MLYNILLLLLYCVLSFATVKDYTRVVVMFPLPLMCAPGHFYSPPTILLTCASSARVSALNPTSTHGEDPGQWNLSFPAADGGEGWGSRWGDRRRRSWRGREADARKKSVNSLTRVHTLSVHVGLWIFVWHWEWRFILTATGFERAPFGILRILRGMIQNQMS